MIKYGKMHIICNTSFHIYKKVNVFLWKDKYVKKCDVVSSLLILQKINIFFMLRYIELDLL